MSLEENPKPNGIWKQVGYGKIIVLNDTTIKVYDITKQNCNLSYEEEILDFGKIRNYTNDTLTIQHGIDNWQFIRLDNLPELCIVKNDQNNDPKYNFQTL
jgi:carboxyl-terminal processing protease